MPGVAHGATRVRWAFLALAICVVTAMVSLLWACSALTLWVLLGISLVSLQQIVLGTREIRRGKRCG